MLRETFPCLIQTGEGFLSTFVISLDSSLLSRTDFLLHVVLQILWAVPWSAFHSGCSVSLAAAVPLAAAIIVDGAVYFVLLPPPHAGDLGAPSLNRLSC